MNHALSNYGWNSNEAPESCNYLAPKILQLLKFYKGIRVCDVGCGNGALAGELKSAGFYVVGVEYSEDGVRLAEALNPEIAFYNLGVQDNSSVVRDSEGAFDAVVSTEVVEHLFSPQQLPIFARGLLNEGGIFLITTPYHGYLKNLMISIFGLWDRHHTAMWSGGHIKFWSRKTLTTLLEENGFKVIAFHGVGRTLFLWKSMVIVAKAI